MASKFKIQDRQRIRGNTERRNSSFPKEPGEIADLHKPVLNKMMTTYK